MKKINFLYTVILGGMILLTISAGFSKPDGVFNSRAEAFDNGSKTSDKLYKETKEEVGNLQENDNKSTKDKAFGQVENPEFPSYYAVENEFIYYLSPYDFKIYRINKDGKNKKLISKDIVNYNGIILHGDWIYFINLSKGETLYRVSKDGIKAERVTEGKVAQDFECFFKYRENLYYYDEKDVIHSLDIRGKETALSDKLRNILANITIGSRVYDNNLYVAGIEGIERVSLFDGTRIKLTSDSVYDFKIYNDLIYYIDYKDHRLYSMDLSGDRKIAVIRDDVMREGPDYDTGRFYITGQNIYYIGYQKEKEGVLYSSRLDGSHREIIAQRAEDFIFDGNNIYYMDGYDNGQLFRIDISTGDKSLLTGGDLTFCLDAIDDLVFYGVKSTEATEAFDGRIFFIGKDGKNKTELR